LIRIANIQIPLPPVEQQRSVVSKLDVSVSRIDALVGTITASFDRLKEYRSALITSAVTGQIDVSTWTRSSTADRQLDAIQAEMEA
jgi:type I restriction enzyme S subunit